MFDVLDAEPRFINAGGASRRAVARPDYRPVTKFERRGERMGHAVQDLIYLRASDLKKGRYGAVQKLVTQCCRDELLGSRGRYPPS